MARYTNEAAIFLLAATTLDGGGVPFTAWNACTVARRLRTHSAAGQHLFSICGEPSGTHSAHWHARRRSGAQGGGAHLVEGAAAEQEVAPLAKLKEGPSQQAAVCKEEGREVKERWRSVQAPFAQVLAAACRCIGTASGSSDGDAIRAVGADADGTQHRDHQCAGEVQVAPLPRVTTDRAAAAALRRAQFCKRHTGTARSTAHFGMGRTPRSAQGP